jgi:hypothetical protein
MRAIPATVLSGVVLGSLAATAGTAPAQPPVAPRLPTAVAADLKSVADQCREVGGKPLTQDAVKRVDLNGDAKDDFVVDLGQVNCDGAAGVYGDREKGVTVYVGDGAAGASNAFSDFVYGAKLVGEGPAAKLWLTVAGEACGRKPAADFASENFCDRAIVWNAKTKKFDYAPLATARMIQ